MSFPIPVRSNWVLLALKNQSVRLPLCESQVFFLSAPVWVQGYCLHSKIWYQLRYVETRDKCKGIGKIIIKCVTRKTLTVPNSSRKLGMHFTLAIKIYLSYVELLCIFFPQITFMWHFGLLVFLRLIPENVNVSTFLCFYSNQQDLSMLSEDLLYVSICRQCAAFLHNLKLALNFTFVFSYWWALKLVSFGHCDGILGFRAFSVL